VKTIFLTIILAFLFVGNVGLDVYKHICEEDGVSVAYVFNTIDHCDSHVEDLPPCCQEEHEEKDCCEDEVSYFQIKLDFFQQLGQIDFVSIETNPIVAVFADEVVVEKPILSFSDTDPPPLETLERLSRLQTYLI
jgi:hypothetical protein